MFKEKIKAPPGTVLKGYMYDHTKYYTLVKRILIDENGQVYVVGHGWVDLQHWCNIRVFANPVEHDGWEWDQWWEKNWQCDSWAWCYMNPLSSFFPKEERSEETSQGVSAML